MESSFNIIIFLYLFAVDIDWIIKLPGSYMSEVTDKIHLLSTHKKYICSSVVDGNVIIAQSYVICNSVTRKNSRHAYNLLCILDVCMH